MNKKGEIPQCGSPGKLLSRGDFITKGDPKAFFAKDQGPGAIQEYRKPKDWNKEESLLRVPQQVLLTSSFYNGSSVYDQQNPPDEGEEVNKDKFDIYSVKQYVLVRYMLDIYQNYGWTGVQHPNPGDSSVNYTETKVGFTDGYSNDIIISKHNDPPGITCTASFQNDHQYWELASPEGGGDGSTYAPPPAKFWLPAVPNYNYDEYQRTIKIFNNVKKKIEALRPGRTWIDVVDLTKYLTFDRDPPPPPPYYENIEGHIWTLVPSDKYFGTQFLHIFAGNPTDGAGRPSIYRDHDVFKYLEDKTKWQTAHDSLGRPRLVDYIRIDNIPDNHIRTLDFIGNGSVCEWNTIYIEEITGSNNATFINSTPYIDDGYPSSNSGYKSDIDKVKQEAKKFSKYGAYLYASDENGDLQKLIEVPSDLDPTIFGGEHGETSSESLSIQNVNTTIKGYVAMLNGCLPSIGKNSKTIFKQTADDLQAQGFQYKGDTSQITEQNLIQQIAEYFKFDPGNGKDL